MQVKPQNKPEISKKHAIMSQLSKETLPKYFLAFVTILIFFGFGMVSSRMFTLSNIVSILCTSAIVGILAFSVVIAMASGEMNFAVGAVATVAAVTVGKISGLVAPITITQQIHIYLAGVLVALVVSAFFGWVASLFILKIGVPSFIATFGLSTLIMGLVKFLSENKNLFSRNWKQAFLFIGQGSIGPIPVILILFIIVSAWLWLLVDRTRLGNHIFSVGANPTACKQVGINTSQIKTISLVLSFILAGLAGILIASREAMVRPTLGSEIMLDAIAAAMLGATFLRPGRFNIQGTIVATILTTVINNGIYTIGAPYEWRMISQGIIFIIAVGFIAKLRKGGLPEIKLGK